MSMRAQVMEDLNAQECRRSRVKYKLRVIEGSGGMLELIEEEQPKVHWFLEWARATQDIGWGM